jgi:hypothetical protein
MSWETIPWKWSPEGPLTEVSDFRFFDEKHGLVWINNSLGKGEVYETSDSGRSWRSLWKTSYGEAPPFWQSDDPSKAVPGSGFWPEVPHVTEAGAEGYFTLRIQSIWRDAAGKDVPSQEFDNRCPNLDCASVYIVERLNSNERRSEDDEKPEVWRKVGEIPGEYALRGGALKPLEVRRK